MNYSICTNKGYSFFNNDLLNQVLWFNNILSVDDYKKITDNDFPYFFENNQEFIRKIDSHKNGKIIIIGDYDADGTCATAILIKFLEYLNISCDYIIGNRMTDGYGMNNDLIDEAIKKNATLIITVDNGIKCKSQVEYAKMNNLDIIITDHHQIDLELLPDCLIFNPHYKEKMLFEDICGALTAFVLVYGYFKNNNISDKDFVYELYELAALATIGDVMPLYYFNRKIVEVLVKRINQNQIINLGLKKLIEVLELKDVTANDIAFKIIPVLNAPGRLETANIIVDILTKKANLDEKINLALSLNIKRKDETKIALSSVLLEDTTINVLHIPDLCEGIIGIIAGAIVSKTKKPTFVFTNTSNGQYKGSARSIEGFDILELVNKNITDDIISYGGHKSALGITLKSKEAFLVLKDMIKNTPINITPSITCINYQFSSFMDSFEILKVLEPFGEGLVPPTFYIEGKPLNIRILKNAHSAFEMKINNKNESFILFNHVISSDYVKLAFTIKKETYNGRTNYKGFVDELL